MDVLRGVLVVERRTGRERFGRRKARVLERRMDVEVEGEASPKMKNFIKAKISRAMDSWPRKNAARAFIVKADGEDGARWCVVDDVWNW